MKIGCITHFFNEELLMKDFILHHRDLFDEVIMIDHASTDNSVNIIKELAPDWKIVKTKLDYFDAWKNDLEVMEYEHILKTDWKIVLNITEFLFIPDLKERLKYSKTQAVGIRSVCLVDKEENLPIENPLWKNRTWGYLNYDSRSPIIRRWRYIHNSLDGSYHIGRHGTNLPATCFSDMLLLYFEFSPYPECIERKHQIQSRIPESDKIKGLGYEHIASIEQFKNRRLERLKHSYNLLDNPVFNSCYNWFYEKTNSII